MPAASTEIDLSNPRTRPVRGLAPALDVVGLVAFVVIGHGQHRIHAGLGELVETLWPFLVGWFAGALAFRLYADPLSWRRAVPTWLVGVALAIWLRVAVTHHAFLPVFAAVATAFIGLALLGWRLLAIGWRARR